ncbi:MAG: hypothetical protein HOO98_00560 [Nitrospira sp.]|nr:hypothetical protein [Nitrospira sp.]
MARTASFCSFARLMTAALLAERQGCSADDAVGALQELTQGSDFSAPANSQRWPVWRECRRAIFFCRRTHELVL